MFKNTETEVNACTVGNYALILKKVLEFDHCDSLKVQIQEEFDAFIEKQKTIAVRPNNCCVM